MSTKAVNQDTHNEPPLLYTYARVDLDAKRVRFVVHIAKYCCLWLYKYMLNKNRKCEANQKPKWLYVSSQKL